MLAVEIVVNLATHPLLWFGLLRLPGPYLRNLCGAEIVVVIVEVALGLLLLRGIASRRRIALAITAANGATFLMTFLPW